MSTAIPATAPEARGTRNVSDILIQSSRFIPAISNYILIYLPFYPPCFLSAISFTHVFSIGWQVEVTFLKSYGCAKLKRAEDKEIMFLVLYGSHHWCGPMDVTRMGCVYIVSYTYTLCYTI